MRTFLVKVLPLLVGIATLVQHNDWLQTLDFYHRCFTVSWIALSCMTVGPIISSLIRFCDIGLHQQKKIEEDASVAFLRAWTKKCPRCRCTVWKDRGCYHMLCSRCYREFCWECLGYWIRGHSSYFCPATGHRPPYYRWPYYR
ncbi:hypothetical protein BDZ45DRAFT_496867 [Acephala macrosclerotiorum]|nr:hypothetical protein BDZ45DRAFT_496867 [Acephala macrosclerotiorum]